MCRRLHRVRTFQNPFVYSPLLLTRFRYRSKDQEILGRKIPRDAGFDDMEPESTVFDPPKKQSKGKAKQTQSKPATFLTSNNSLDALYCLHNYYIMARQRTNPELEQVPTRVRPNSSNVDLRLFLFNASTTTAWLEAKHGTWQRHLSAMAKARSHSRNHNRIFPSLRIHFASLVSTCFGIKNSRINP